MRCHLLPQLPLPLAVTQDPLTLQLLQLVAWCQNQQQLRLPPAAVPRPGAAAAAAPAVAPAAAATLDCHLLLLLLVLCHCHQLLLFPLLLLLVLALQGADWGRAPYLLPVDPAPPPHQLLLLPPGTRIQLAPPSSNC
jgi:hypothetical protein